MILVLDIRGPESPLYRDLERAWSWLPKRTAKQRQKAARALPVALSRDLTGSELRTLLGHVSVLAVGSMTEAQQLVFKAAVESGVEVWSGDRQ